jgi:dTMP kinase
MCNGKFFVFEGIDGAGKSTIIKSLVPKIEALGYKVYVTAEPTKNYIGTHIREILTNKRDGDEKTIASLFLADRIDHLTHPEYGMVHKINDGFIVLCDRYYLSSYAYHVPHVSLDWVIEANSICANVKRPDINFYIDISVEESLRRLTAGRASLDKYENFERISTVKKNYEAAIRKVENEEKILKVDGNLAPEELTNFVFNEIMKNIEQSN